MARREALRAERSAIQGLVNDGAISQDAFDQISAEIDLKLTQDGESMPISEEG
jgi:hypothetical protein